MLKDLKTYEEMEQRFIKRVWKRVYRNPDCQCNSCRIVEHHWLIISDVSHAKYLCTLYTDYLSEWIDLNYRDEL